MATFDELVLEISLVEVAESLQAKFYLYEFNFAPSGVSVVAFSVEDTPEKISQTLSEQLQSCLAAPNRVSLAVTWLTVYRQLHIMRPGTE